MTNYNKTFYGTKPNVIISPGGQYLVWNIRWDCWDECPLTLRYLALKPGEGVSSGS